VKLNADELGVLTVALESLDAVRILKWDIDGYPKDTDKTDFIEGLLERLYTEEVSE
jgi:hypothetical protein